MYNEHFGLRELPFGITPDTSFFFPHSSHQEALNTLLVAARTGEGFMKVVGEVGTGKTMLCRKFLDALDREHFVTAYIPNPYLGPNTLLLAVAEELGIANPEGVNQHLLLKLITKSLLDSHVAGRRVVLCLDEAQAMPIETLEALRLLTNLETERRKLLQPAVKCRGREYLRIIYGPEYTAPEHLEELRQRSVTLKRTLALREFALGIEALERFVDQQPLRRVHECVFGVLALESEPVDPRL